MPIEQLLLCGLLFVVAALYSSVGHGGASGYLAVLSFFTFSPPEMAMTALILNILIAGIAFMSYFRAGHFSWKLTWPLLLTSIPAAIIGGAVNVQPGVYMLLLAVILIWAAWKMIRYSTHFEESNTIANPNRLPLIMLLSACIGFVSGLIGIGGGIFLSPLILLFGWANAKKTAAISACYIVINSFAGLFGRFLQGTKTDIIFLPFILTTCIGGLLGASIGSRYLSSSRLRQVLSVVLLMAAIKIILQYF